MSNGDLLRQKSEVLGGNKMRSKSAERGAGGAPSETSGGGSVWSGLNWGMMATWMSLLSTIIFNVQFQFIYRNMQQGRFFKKVVRTTSGAGTTTRESLGHTNVVSKNINAAM